MRSRIIAAMVVVAGLIGLRSALASAAPGAAVDMLSANAAERAAAVSPPLIDAPAFATASIDQFVSIEATATDPDLGDVLTISATGAPASLSFTHTPSVSPAGATLSGTPVSGDEGVHSILWSVSDGSFGANATTELTIAVNHPPDVSAPATVLSAVGYPTAFSASAADSDGESILSLTAAPLPPGAAFSVNFLKTSGEFEWTPGAGQEGVYVIDFTATSGAPAQSATASSEITVQSEDHPVSVSNPGNKTVKTSENLNFTVTATDADGDPVDQFFAKSTAGTGLPPGATFSTTGVGTPSASGVFDWTPGPSQNAVYNFDFSAVSGPFATKVTNVVKVTVVPNPPVVVAPASVTGAEGTLIAFDVTASDPDGEPIASLTASGLPPGATFAANPTNTSGAFSWTPNFSDAGVYSIVFTAANAQASSQTTTIAVAVSPNAAPTASAGGPYTGVAGSPVEFDGSATSDPDGNALTYAWDFGDGSSGTGVTPSHVYASGGAYSAVLTVADDGAPSLSDIDVASVTITSVFEANLFTTGGNKSIKLGSGKPNWCVYMERADGGPLNLDFSSFRLAYGGNEILAVIDKSTLSGDRNRNGLVDAQLCFSKTDLRTLFASLPNGKQTVTVEVGGLLATGAPLVGTIDVEVVGNGGALAASVAPNPLNPEAVLTFATQQSGPLRVRLYDAQGRFVRTLEDRSSAGAGYHDVRIDGRDARGNRLATGVYFYRVESSDGTFGGRVTVLK